MIDSQARQRLIRAAQAVLAANDLGNATRPAPRVYPHQWNWDSALIAIGISHYDQPRAQTEIRSLLKGQWRNGMMPHIIFNPEAGDYHPGPDYWGTAGRTDAPVDVQTSGITQPPILAYAVLQVYRNATDKKQAAAFLAETYPALVNYARYFREQRGAEKDGLAHIIHPWESGLDNSPRWDLPLSRIKIGWQPEYQRVDTNALDGNQRPTNEEYDYYSYLVEFIRKYNYDEGELRELCPFLVQPVLFNSIFCLSLQALIEIGKIIGEPTSELAAWEAKSREAINTRLWDKQNQTYGDFDLRAGELYNTATPMVCSPLLAGIPSQQRANRLIEFLTDPNLYWPQPGYPLPTVAMNDTNFNPDKYWRGPVWIIINWLLILGLKSHGREALAEKLTEKTLELISENGFYEYFNPFTGAGLGAQQFSWTASLGIDLVKKSVLISII